MADLECPYCGEEQEVCHDDGQGYAEDEAHEQECSDCGKTYVFRTSIMYYYEPKKADCLNGSDHVLKMSRTYPKEYSNMECRDCDFRWKPTPDEFAALRESDKQAEKVSREGRRSIRPSQPWPEPGKPAAGKS